MLDIHQAIAKSPELMHNSASLHIFDFKKAIYD